MYRILVDQERNLLWNSFSGIVTPEECRSFQLETKQVLEQLQPKFTILTDLTNLESMAYECAAILRIYMDQCRMHGVARVIRVIPDPSKDIGLAILSVFHFGRNVSIQTMTTLDEALAILPTNHPSPS